MYVAQGDRIRFRVWKLYKGETIPDIPESEWTGEVVRIEGIVMETYNVIRDYDGRKTLLLLRDIAEVLERKRDEPKTKFGKAVAGVVPAADPIPKSGSGSGKGRRKK